MNRPRSLPFILLSLLACGCNVSRPDLFHPGHIYEQQLRATYHDPYGDPDNGPKIPGSRPPDYRVPRAEPVRSQWFPNSYGF